MHNNEDSLQDEAMRAIAVDSQRGVVMRLDYRGGLGPDHFVEILELAGLHVDVKEQLHPPLPPGAVGSAVEPLWHLTVWLTEHAAGTAVDAALMAAVLKAKRVWAGRYIEDADRVSLVRKGRRARGKGRQH